MVQAGAGDVSGLPVSLFRFDRYQILVVVLRQVLGSTQSWDHSLHLHTWGAERESLTVGGAALSSLTENCGRTCVISAPPPALGQLTEKLASPVTMWSQDNIGPDVGAK